MKLVFTGLVLLFFFQYSFAQKDNSEIPRYTIEEADYSLKYGVFKIGEAHAEISYDNKCQGTFIQASAKSTGLVRLFKRIFYIFECCMDPITGFPIQDSRILIEGDYVDSSRVFYDRLSRQDSTIIFSKKTDTIVGPKIIYDLLSGVIYYRQNYLGDNLPKNHTFRLTTFFIDKVWDLRLIYFGKEIIDTKYGSIECLKVNPVTIIGHFFRTSDAMTIWFTNDERHVPVKFTLNFKLGTLYGDIIDYKSLAINNNLR